MECTLIHTQVTEEAASSGGGAAGLSSSTQWRIEDGKKHCVTTTTFPDGRIQTSTTVQVPPPLPPLPSHARSLFLFLVFFESSC